MDGADAVRRTLREAASRMTDLTPLLRAIGERVTAQTKRRFESGGPAPSGIPWAKPKTHNPKRVRTLTVSGHLRDSIRYQLRGRDEVAIGTNKEYAAIHQMGGTRTQGARSELFVRNRYKRGAKKASSKKERKPGRASRLASGKCSPHTWG